MKTSYAGEAELSIDMFLGIDQSKDETALSLRETPDAANMDTEDGNLAVAKGYARHLSEPVPGNAPLSRLMLLHAAGGEPIFLAAAGDMLYGYLNGQWSELHTRQNSEQWHGCAARLRDKNVLILTNSAGAPLVFDGTAVSLLGGAGSELPKAAYATVYCERLFAAGDAENPSRVYYSRAFDLDNWSVGDDAGTGGGYIDIGPSTTDGITGIATLFNAVLVFKRNSLWRISGETPSNFFVDRVYGETEAVAHGTVCAHAETAYMLTSAGLQRYDGLSVAPHADAQKIKTIARRAGGTRRAAEHRNVLYFALRMSEGEGYDDALVTYDVARRCFMLRTGFEFADLLSDGETLYLLTAQRTLVRFGEGTSYDGAPIDAHWRTPTSDFGAKNTVKTALRLYAYGSGEEGAFLALESSFDGRSKTRKRLLSEKPRPVRLAVGNRGRRVQLRFSNEGGKWWKLESGVQLMLELEPD